MNDCLKDILSVPVYLLKIYEFLYLDFIKSPELKEQNPLNHVSTGTDYGYRQVLILMALYGYTPLDAIKRVKEIEPEICKYISTYNQ